MARTSCGLALLLAGYLALIQVPAPAQENHPGFLPPEGRLRDADFPTSAAPVTTEEIDDATEAAGWGTMSREALHAIITGSNGLFVLDRLSGVVLPHADWAQPWAGGKTRVLVMAPVQAARQIVELACRLDGEVTVGFLPEGYNSTPGNEELSIRMLRERLEKCNPEVVVLAGYQGGLPEIIQALRERVQAGMGLVWTLREDRRVDANDTSAWPPEKWVVPGVVDLRVGWPLKTDWVATGEPHVAWSGLPYGALPPVYVPRLVYPGEGWQVLASLGQQPWLLSKQLGQGRLVALLGPSYLFPNTEEPSWRPGQEDRLLDDKSSLLLKALLWAARKDTGVLLTAKAPDTVGWNQTLKVQVSVAQSGLTGAGTMHFSVQDTDYRTLASSKVACGLAPGSIAECALPALGCNGTYYLNAVLRDAAGKSVAWHTVPVTVADGMHLAIAADQDVYKPGETLSASAAPQDDVAAFLPFTLICELWDSYGRIVARSRRDFVAGAAVTPEVRLQTTLENCPGRVMMLVARALREGREIGHAETEVTMPAFGLEGDYHVIAWPVSLSERASLHFQLLRRQGFDGIVLGPWGPPVTTARQAAWNNLGCTLENAFHLATCLSDKYWPGGSPEYDKYFDSTIRPCASQVLRKYGLRLLSISNEASFYKGYGADKPIIPAQVAAFRAYLERVYGTIGALNAQWETAYASFAEVEPLPLNVKPTSLNFSRHVDWQNFMQWFSVQEQKRAVDEYFTVMGGECPWGSSSGGSTEVQAAAGASFHGNTMGDGLKYASGAEPGWYDLFHGGTSGLWAFTGYDWPEEGYDFYPWYNVLHGGKTEFVFISAGAAGLEGAYTRRGLWTRDYERELREGVGKLLATSRRENDAVAFLHSDLSDYVVASYAALASTDKHAPQFYGRFAKSSLFSFVQLVLDAQLHPTFVTEAGVQQGGLAGMKMLFVCNVPAMSAATAAAIQRFAEQGGIVVSDLCTAVFDEHGKLLPQGRLDDFFGFSRETLQLSAYPAEYTLGITQPTKAPYFLPPEWLYVEFHEDGIKVTDGQALGQHIVGKEASAFIFKRHGAGASLYLNYLDSQYRKNRDPRHLNVMRALLKWGQVKPQVEVTDGYVPLPQFDVVRFVDDRAWHAAILRDDTDSRKGAEVVVNFAQEGHAYDVRDKQYLGYGKSFKVSVPRWRPKLLSLLPGRIDEVTVTGGASVKAGETLKYTVTPKLTGATTSLVYRITVTAPDGSTSEAYSTKVRTGPGRAVYPGVLRTALNDRPGTWTLTATEIVSGKSGWLSFRVTP